MGRFDLIFYLNIEVMAIFNILAKNEVDFDYKRVLDEVQSFPLKYISIFPIVSIDSEFCEGFGVTASGKDCSNIDDIKKELVFVLSLFFSESFVVKDLYTGDKLTRENYIHILGYFW